MADIEFDAQEEMMEEEDQQQPEPAMAEEPSQPQQRLKSSVVAADGAGDASKKKKGRGHREGGERGEQMGGRYESVTQGGGQGPARSVEGWVLFISGVHEEAQEEDLTEAFGDFGDVKNVYLNLDRQTGFVKGYALVEYANQKEAQAAIDGMDGKELLTQPVKVTWAFTKAAGKATRAAPARRR
jgi:RNA-binding protein 8A